MSFKNFKGFTQKDIEVIQKMHYRSDKTAKSIATCFDCSIELINYYLFEHERLYRYVPIKRIKEISEATKERKKYRNQFKKNKFPNKKFAKYLKINLENIGKNQGWLAKEINVSKQVMSNCIREKNIPIEEIQDKIFNVFNTGHKTLKDILEDESIIIDWEEFE